MILFSTPSNKASLSRRLRDGRLRRVHEGVYTDDLSEPLDDVVRNNLTEIVAHYWPGAVITDRSAFDGGPRDGWLFVAHPEPPRKQDLELPGVSVSARKGVGAIEGDMPLPHGLALAGRARALLENAGSKVRRPPKSRPPRALSRAELEDQVDSLARDRADTKMHALLSEAERIAPTLHLEDALPTVRRLIVAALGTAEGAIKSPRLSARAAGLAYDHRRVELFRDLSETLNNIAPMVRPADHRDRRWAELPFFEAYFSNFIEGTEFEISEARAIALEGFEPTDRPEDAHDIRGTFEVVGDLIEMQRTPRDADGFIELMKERHAHILGGRPAKNPGAFKHTNNRVGAHEFVAHELVVGTLKAGFEEADRLLHPFHRCVFLMFLVTETHPFLDGNGRVARVMANAELVAGGETRIVIPSIYRTNYLVGLRAVSNGTNPGETLFDVLDFARKWVSGVEWSTLSATLRDLERSNALLDPGVADQEGKRLTLP